MPRRTTTLLMCCLTLAGCGAASAEPPAQAGLPDAAPVQVAQQAGQQTGQPAPAAVSGQSFAAWVADLRPEALARGVSAATFDSAFAGVGPSDRVLELDTSQPEFTRPIWEYLASAVSDARIADGQRNYQANRAALDAAAAAYGVQPQYLLAIWGIESNYGQNIGSFNVVQALATLAWHGRRAAAFRTYLIEALLILERGDVAPDRMLGSWAGAMGQPQFMPTAYLQYAVDGNGDGRRDIWTTNADVFASTANYLAQHGWQPGQRWGREVALPAGFDYSLADAESRRSLVEWQALGVRQADGTALPAEGFQAELVVPAGARGPAFLLYDNFRAILRYNTSTAYALAVGHLADRIAGAGPIRARWPEGDRPLSRTETIEMQRLLTARGFDTGGLDGVIGPQTRAAVRRYQQTIGAPADGYASAELLNRLRAGG